MQETSHDELFNKLNRETAKIRWRELQPFYAAGQLVVLDNRLDLVAIAVQFSLDNKALISDLMANKQLALADDASAKTWQDDTLFWAVVLAPWVLIQQVQ